MRMYIDMTECKNCCGKTIAVAPRVSIETDIDDGYDVEALRKLKADLQAMLDQRLPHCLGGN